jgi:hypothetical protein
MDEGSTHSEGVWESFNLSEKHLALFFRSSYSQVSELQPPLPNPSPALLLPCWLVLELLELVAPQGPMQSGFSRLPPLPHHPFSYSIQAIIPVPAAALLASGSWKCDLAH